MRKVLYYSFVPGEFAEVQKEVKCIGSEQPPGKWAELELDPKSSPGSKIELCL